MVEQMNRKYRSAQTQGKKCLSLIESFALHKIPNDSEVIAYLSRQMQDALGIEYPENYFTRTNLFNSNYHDVSFHDFEKYFYLSELSGFKDSGREMLKSLLNDSDNTFESPILVKGKNKIYWQLNGNLQMMAYKVLGIFPVVKEISINANIIP